MTLKNRIANDIHRCFMRMDHFAETHFWNGFEITCVPDEEEALKRKVHSVSDVGWDSNTRSLLIHTPVDTFPAGITPEANTQIMFDSRPMRVLQVDHNMGMWDIVLAAFEPMEL